MIYLGLTALVVAVVALGVAILASTFNGEERLSHVKATLNAFTERVKKLETARDDQTRTLNHMTAWNAQRVADISSLSSKLAAHTAHCGPCPECGKSDEKLAQWQRTVELKLSTLRDDYTRHALGAPTHNELKNNIEALRHNTVNDVGRLEQDIADLEAKFNHRRRR